MLSDLQYFLSALLDEQVEIQNPYIWKTKSEVATVIGQSGQVDLLSQTISCSHVYGMTKLKTHCGCCSQCLDRRFATLAAGLGDADPEEMYAVDLLTGPRDEGKNRTMAENFVRHAREFVSLTEMGFVGRFGGHVSRAAGCFPGLTADQVMKNAVSLNQRHGQAVVSVLEAGFNRHARALAEGILPGTCLLRLVGDAHGHVSETAIRDPTETESLATPRDSRDFARTSEIRLALDPNGSVLIGGIEPIRGRASSTLIATLVEAYETDGREGRAPENYRYVSSSILTRALKITDVGLRRRVARFRKQVAQSFERRFGLPIGADSVVQSERWQGYRLNPAIRVVAFDQIKLGRKGHEVDAKSHDSSMRPKQ